MTVKRVAYRADLRPIIYVEGHAIKKYLQKKTNKLKLSKNPLCSFSYECQDSCRETLVHGLGNNISRCTTNELANNNPYNLEPLIFLKNKKKKPQIGNSDISLNVSCLALEDIETFQDDENVAEYATKLISYIPGIIGTAMSNSPLEDLRAQKIHGNSSYVSFDGDFFYFTALSNFWLVSPVTVSIMTGLTRNAISHALDENYYEDELFSSISYSDVKSIINNHRRDKAQEVFKDIILPFYDRHYNKAGEGYFLLDKDFSKSERKVIENLVKHGVHTFFKLENMNHYWQDFHHHYGVMRFAEDYGTDIKRWKDI
jgi:hypothetical protein